MAEFMLLICDDEKAREATPQSDFVAAYAKVREWWDELEKKGLFVPNAGRRLQPSRTAKTVRVGGGSAAAVTDGPFVETKELLGGYGLITAPDIETVVEALKSWPGLEVALEVRPVITA